LHAIGTDNISDDGQTTDVYPFLHSREKYITVLSGLFKKTPNNPK
jgi:hypothetical protein